MDLGVQNLPNVALVGAQGLGSLIFFRFSPITENRVRLIILCILSCRAAPQLVLGRRSPAAVSAATRANLGLIGPFLEKENLVVMKRVRMRRE